MINSTLIFFVLLPASISDLYYYKVPNAIILIGLFLSFLLRMASDGLESLFPWLIGALLPFLLCFILYLIGALGASDVKLFSVVGSFYDVKTGLNIVVVSFCVGALFSIIHMICMKNTKERFTILFTYILCLISTKKPTPYPKGEGGIIPFAICISLGTMIVIAAGYN